MYLFVSELYIHVYQNARCNNKNVTAYCSRYYAQDNNSINIKQTLSLDGKTHIIL